MGRGRRYSARPHTIQQQASGQIFKDDVNGFPPPGYLLDDRYCVKDIRVPVFKFIVPYWGIQSTMAYVWRSGPPAYVA